MKQISHMLSIVLILWTSALAQPPEPVVTLRQKVLSKESYMSLVQQWLDYMDEHGESTEGHLNVAQAQRYAGEAKELYLRHYRRAVELEPNSVRALDLCGSFTWRLGTPEDKAQGRQMLERAKNLDPSYGEILYSLYGMYCCEGRLDETEDIASDIYRRGIISTPLQDFGYNLLAGLPEKAVLFTNGDNDTYPPISLQAGLGYREDVLVLNINLLKCEEYAQAIAERYPDWFPQSKATADSGRLSTAKAVATELLRTGKHPLYAAISVDFDDLPCTRTIQGLCARIDRLEGDEAHIDEKKTFSLLRDVYRLDSATNWAYPWELRNAERMLMNNYCALAYRAAVASREHGDEEAARFLAAMGRHIAEFHELGAAIAAFDELIGSND